MGILSGQHQQSICNVPSLEACPVPPGDIVTQQPFFVVALACLLALFVAVVLWILVLRRYTKWQLERRGLPTTMWRPRFVSYRPFEEDQKLSSSTITRILPRMERLGGPFGMYGTVYGLNTPVIHVAHPVPARAIFGTSSNGATATSSNGAPSSQRGVRASVAWSTGASKAPAYDHFKNFCGEGVFTADGEDWKAKRASIMHCLLRGATTTNSAKSSNLSQRLEQEANRAADTFIAQVENLRHGSDRSVVTNVVPLLQRSTVGLIYRYITHHEPAWGVPAHAADEETFETTSLSSTESSSSTSLESSTNADEHQEREKGAAEDDRAAASGLLDRYLKSIIRIRMIILAQSRSIWFVLPRWCYSSFSSLYRDEETTLIPIRTFSQHACECAQPGSPLAQLQTMESHNKTTPGTSPHSTKSSSTSTSTTSSVPVFSKDVLDEAITLLFAGQDTSAATLSWTLHLLSIYPEIQSRLASELKTVVLGGDESTEQVDKVKITKQLISKLPFLDAVIKESMRLYPVAPFVVRRIQSELFIADDAVGGGGGGINTDNSTKVSLPAGSVACIWIYGLHRNPEFWDRPNDFLPDRWLKEPTEKDIGQTNGAYMPFAAGPRNCVGQPIAQVVLRTLLAQLILRFEFRDNRLLDDEAAASPGDIRKEMQAGFTVMPSGGVSVAIRSRAQQDNATFL